MRYPPQLRQLCMALSEAAKAHPLVVVPGGGNFADTVRTMDRQFGLSAVATHRMAIYGMDQYGLMLADLAPNALAVDTLEAAKSATAGGKLAILLVSNLMSTQDPLPNSWAVTSDSIAAYIAAQLGAHQLVLLKDVDGVFSGHPKNNPMAQLIRTISAAELLTSETPVGVDLFLPRILLQNRLNCWVVNGLYPDRLKAILGGHETVGTLIAAQ